jgi:hypothetical protein
MSEGIHILNAEGLRDVNAKSLIPYLPLLEIFRAARAKDLTLGVYSWRENSSGRDVFMFQ